MDQAYPPESSLLHPFQPVPFPPPHGQSPTDERDWRPHQIEWKSPFLASLLSRSSLSRVVDADKIRVRRSDIGRQSVDSGLRSTRRRLSTFSRRLGSGGHRLSGFGGTLSRSGSRSGGSGIGNALVGLLLDLIHGTDEIRLFRGRKTGNGPNISGSGRTDVATSLRLLTRLEFLSLVVANVSASEFLKRSDRVFVRFDKVGKFLQGVVGITRTTEERVLDFLTLGRDLGGNLRTRPRVGRVVRFIVDLRTDVGLNGVDGGLQLIDSHHDRRFLTGGQRTDITNRRDLGKQVLYVGTNLRSKRRNLGIKSRSHLILLWHLSKFQAGPWQAGHCPRHHPCPL